MSTTGTTRASQPGSHQVRRPIARSRACARARTAAVLLAAFTIVAVALAIAAPRVRVPSVERLVRETMEASGQLAVRIRLLLLIGLVYLAVDLGLELVLGAFAAGAIDGVAARGAPGAAIMKTKLDAIAFGFLVPVFFIRSGVTFDLSGLIDSPAALAQLPIFVALSLLARGAAPSWRPAAWAAWRSSPSAS